jgi:hypothetical protein
MFSYLVDTVDMWINKLLRTIVEYVDVMLIGMWINQTCNIKYLFNQITFLSTGLHSLYI